MTGRGVTVRGDAPMRTYEVHLGSWRRGVADWDTLAAQLGDHVASLGFTHVELLPVAEHPFGGSWGYQVSGYYAPTARFGDPGGLARFVDAMHQRGIGVIVDWVPAHFPRDEWSLGRFDGTPLSEHPDPGAANTPSGGPTYSTSGATRCATSWSPTPSTCSTSSTSTGCTSTRWRRSCISTTRGTRRLGVRRVRSAGDLDAIRFLRETNSVVGEELPDVLMVAEE